MREARPVEPPDWVLRGELAQGLASHLGLGLPTDDPLIPAGLMQITHKNQLLSSYLQLESLSFIA